MNVITYCDGQTSVYDIANKLSINLADVLEEIKTLNDYDLVEML